MIRRFSFYDKATGLFSGRIDFVDDADRVDQYISANVATGHGALEGMFDHLSQKVDIETGKVIDYQPPAPSSDHEWNATTKRWELSQAVQQRRAAHEAAMARIASLEASAHRPLREALLGVAGSRERLERIEAQIAELRKDL